MEYPYFHTQTTQPYQFFGLPPTPSHSNSALSDHDYSSHSPPDAFEQFNSFDHNAHFVNSAFPQTPAKMALVGSTGVKNVNGNPNGNGNTIGNGYEGMGGQEGEDGKRGSGSDDENLPPAQARRKAQNRAAQRAFRERKERHVKDLEAQLAQAKQTIDKDASEKASLKAALERASTQNEILRATSNASPATPIPTSGPMRYSPTDFFTDVLSKHDNKTPSHRIVTSPKGERLLAAGAAWDLIVGHELSQRGLVDVGVVSEKLKKFARCDGQGPVFEEGLVIQAIESSAASGSDELM